MFPRNWQRVKNSCKRLKMKDPVGSSNSPCEQVYTLWSWKPIKPLREVPSGTDHWKLIGGNQVAMLYIRTQVEKRHKGSKDRQCSRNAEKTIENPCPILWWTENGKSVACELSNPMQTDRPFWLDSRLETRMNRSIILCSFSTFEIAELFHSKKPITNLLLVTTSTWATSLSTVFSEDSIKLRLTDIFESRQCKTYFWCDHRKEEENRR